MQSSVYVSRPSPGPGDRSAILADILAVAIERNTALDISGILITTPNFFAQVLEGPSANVALVMASIRKDPRHYAVRDLWSSEEKTRRYPRWRMARFDAAQFGPIQLDPILLACHEGHEGRHSPANTRLRRILALISFNLSYLSAPALAAKQSEGLLI